MFRITTDFLFNNIKLDKYEYNCEYNIFSFDIKHIRAKDVIIEDIYMYQNNKYMLLLKLYSSNKFTFLGEIKIEFLKNNIFNYLDWFKGYKFEQINNFKIFMKPQPYQTYVVLVPVIFYNNNTFNIMKYNNLKKLLENINNNLHERNYNINIRLLIQLIEKHIKKVKILFDIVYQNNNFMILQNNKEFASYFYKYIDIYKNNKLYNSKNLPIITILYTFIDLLKSNGLIKTDVVYTINKLQQNDLKLNLI
ncbi:hypothetical protein DEFDS_P229 (plasmid) [Deferribacter desulfuricans SSM1]|uniref:Uncharacterized protein n=1 Tax=Deferribacter desulfuricans (strain DSM 14783 / JCM 11476 / NBRC 101012 / SSM1) TaxID=639282 RepID=D3PF57_DEFDS|nr:hypothetical protein [Deferribacter desulfuricans]BAI81849.1 hypothetical protein DEFDS_P229 [Deferribacter desulfuricans SSM1]